MEPTAAAAEVQLPDAEAEARTAAMPTSSHEQGKDKNKSQWRTKTFQRLGGRLRPKKLSEPISASDDNSERVESAVNINVNGEAVEDAINIVVSNGEAVEEDSSPCQNPTLLTIRGSPRHPVPSDGVLDSKGSPSAKGEWLKSSPSSKLTVPLPKRPAGSPSVRIADITEPSPGTLSPMSEWSIRLPHPAALSFRNVGFAVKMSQKKACSCGKPKVKKHIVRGVSGSAVGGRMLAIVGGSGSGKTTLLDTLAGRRTQGREVVTGSVMINGTPLTEERFHNCGAFVAQESQLWGSLTTRETLLYCAEFYGTSSSRKEREMLVDEVLVQTGLVSCQDTRVGSLFIKGLSGGQQKRLCVAEALVKRPALVLLDEPTGGLDSSSAQKVMEVLQNLTRSNLLVLCTIHQPSQRVFSLFDDTLVLAQGQVAYSGPISKAADYMAELGMGAIKKGVSLSEYLLDLCNPDFTDPTQVQHILEQWKPSPEPEIPSEANLAAPRTMRPLGSQVAILTRRLAVMAFRDPTIYSARWIFAMLSSIAFSVVYVACNERVQDQVLPRIRLLSWLIGAPAFMTVIVIAVYNQDFHVYKKEVRNGMYTPLAYVIAQTVVMIPGTLVLSGFAIIPSHAIVGYSWRFLPQIWLAHTVTMFWADCVGQLLAVVLPHFLMAMVAFIMTMAIALVQSGISISVASLIWPIRWVAYVNPWMYSLRTMVWYDFVDAEFSGYEDCVDLCFGNKGHIVLDNLNRLMSSISSERTARVDLLISIGITVSVKLVHFGLMRFKR